MNIDSPTPASISLLIVFLPGIWRLARQLAVKLDNGDKHRHYLFCSAFFVLLWLSAVHIAGLITGSFRAGLIVGTILPALPGYYLLFSTGLFLNPTFENPALTTRTFRLILSGALGASLLLLPLIFSWDFHDRIETLYSHFSITSQILNDIYPPRDLMFAHQNLSYHFGVDTFFAMIIAITRLPADQVIDIITLVFWFYTLCLFGYLGNQLYGERGGLSGVLLGGFAGGFVWFLPDLTNSTYAMLGAHFMIHSGAALSASKGIINAPFISHFFQPPWMLGTAVLLVLLLMISRPQEQRLNHAMMLATLLCLSVLSFSNITIFLSLACSLAAFSLFEYCTADRALHKRPFLLLPFYASILALALAPLLTNFLMALLDTGDSNRGIYIANGGIAGNWSASLSWNIATFGLLLPLGLYSLSRFSNYRVLLGLLIFGALFCVNFFAYERSHDIVKFATLVQIILAVCCVGALAEWLSSNSLWKKALAYMSGIFIISSGFLFLIPFWFNYPSLPFKQALVKQTEQLQISPDFYDAVSWLRSHISAGEVVLCLPESDQSNLCAWLGGFPQFLPDKYMSAAIFGHSNQAIMQRIILYDEKPLVIEPYLAEGLRWLLFPEGALPWEILADTWVTSNHARLVQQFGSYQVYQLTYANL